MDITRENYEYLLGVYLGDGNRIKNYGIRISIGKDVYAYAQHIAKLFLPYKTHIYKDYYKGKKYESFCYRIVLNKKDFVLNNFVRYKNKGRWILPKLKYPQYFLAGIFDTDGSIRGKSKKRIKREYNSTEIVIYQKLKGNLELIIPLFDRLNLFPTLKHHSENMWLLRFSHFTQIKTFSRTIPSQHPQKSEKLTSTHNKGGMMDKITLIDIPKDIIIKLSEGNPGALRVCIEILQQGKLIDPDGAMGGLGVLLSLDTLKIYGSKIWMLYKDVCKENLIDMLAVLRANQLGYISDSQVKYAIENRGMGIDITECYKKVKARLPNFRNHPT